MENNSRVLPKKGLKTKLTSVSEAERYLQILGAQIIELDNSLDFIFHGLQGGIMRNGHLDLLLSGNIMSQLHQYGCDLSPDQGIGYLDDLVLLDTIFKGEDVDICFASNLYKTRKQMLVNILNNRGTLKFEGLFSEFDKKVAPFLDEGFDIDRFLRECIFNTEGYYRAGHFNKCLSFKWHTESDPSISYSFHSEQAGFEDSIYVRENRDRSTHFSHTTIGDKYSDRKNEEVYYDKGEDTCIQLTAKDGSKPLDGENILISVSERGALRPPPRKATEQEISDSVNIASKFAQKAPSFIKTPKKETSITTQKIGLATIGASTTAKQEAERAEAGEIQNKGKEEKGE